MVTAGEAGDWSYWRVLRSGRLGALLAGSLISSVGNGMIISALPLLALQIRWRLSAGLVIALVQASPYILATALALTLGLTRLRLPPRGLLLADSALRSAAFVLLGLLAVTGTLALWMLVCGLLAGSVFQIAAASGRRLLATGMTGPAGQLAVNGLLGTSASLASYLIGPVAGGVISAVASPGVALIIDGLTFVVMLGAAYFAAPAKPGTSTAQPRSSTAQPRSSTPQPRPARPASGLHILRTIPAAARLFAVVFWFNLLYMPVEVALPLLVRGPLHANGTALGLIWSGFGAGAVLGGMATVRLRRIPRQRVLVTIIAAWGGAVLLLGFAPSVILAAGAFFLGGLVYAPFTPIAYTYVQSMLTPDEQQPVVTLWSAGGVLAGPVGLAFAGPLVSAAGARGGLIVSAVATVALVPLAGIGLRRAAARAAAVPARSGP
jgi:MFS family permease